MHEQEGFFEQRNDEIEMDFDDINDLVNELKPEKKASEKAEDIDVVSHNNAH